MSTDIIPPPRPLQERITFLPCDFEYLSCSSREFVKDAYDVISRKELWQPFRLELLMRGVCSITGFMFTENPVYNKVQSEIASTDVGCRHSGCSMAYVMREMEFIALNGEPAYKQRWQQNR